jgi:DNA-binding NarL/FixJ family response regulator
MEPINGLQVLGLIRRGAVNGVPRDQRLIMLTAHANANLVSLGAALDVNGYLVKPIAIEKLVGVIDLTFKKPFNAKPAKEYAAVKVPPVPPHLLETPGGAGLVKRR